jgi:chemotaxis protein methyltransferase CheR
MPVNLTTLELTDTQFEQISAMTYKLCGINLHDGKEGLVKGRLMKRLRQLDIGSFDEYLRFVEHDKSREELTAMIDALTTNKTSFFRESQHFDFLRDQVLPELRSKGNPIRIWCAGCSSGEEPYTLAIVLREAIPELDKIDARILATDISTRVLKTAREGMYDPAHVSDIPADLRQRYFDVVPGGYRVKPSLSSIVQFARLNLMEPWPMKGHFNAIFCRNVMIYFDKPTQKTLVQRFWDCLQPGGYLFVGHSESINAWASEYRYVRPATYVK